MQILHWAGGGKNQATIYTASKKHRRQRGELWRFEQSLEVGAHSYTQKINEQRERERGWGEGREMKPTQEIRNTHNVAAPDIHVFCYRGLKDAKQEHTHTHH